MSRLALLLVLLFISTQLLFAQKKNHYHLNTPKLDFVSAVSKTLIPSNTIETITFVAVKSEDSVTLQAKSAPIKKKTMPAMPKKLDSMWLASGGTLAGRITFDKDSNTFFLFKDTANSIELKPSEVVKLIIFPKTNEEERLDVMSFSNEFYFLESDSKATIQIFAKRTFKPILDDGPKSYFVQSKYCLLKNNVPYLLNSDKTKETLVFLMDDCKKVKENFKKGIFSEDNFIEAVIQYNRCYSF